MNPWQQQTNKQVPAIEFLRSSFSAPESVQSVARHRAGRPALLTWDLLKEPRKSVYLKDYIFLIFTRYGDFNHRENKRIT